MDITFKNHPAQARHPITKSPLFNDNGDPVPLFPNQRAVYLDGVMCGYCGSKPNEPVTLIVHLPIEIVELIEARVAETFGKPTSVNQPPLMPESPLPLEVDE